MAKLDFSPIYIIILFFCKDFNEISSLPLLNSNSHVPTRLVSPCNIHIHFLILHFSKLIVISIL